MGRKNNKGESPMKSLLKYNLISLLFFSGISYASDHSLYITVQDLSSVNPAPVLSLYKTNQNIHWVDDDAVVKVGDTVEHVAARVLKFNRKSIYDGDAGVTFGTSDALNTCKIAMQRTTKDFGMHDYFTVETRASGNIGCVLQQSDSKHYTVSITNIRYIASKKGTTNIL
jgi:hypothetical protein